MMHGQRERPAAAGGYPVVSRWHLAAPPGAPDSGGQVTCPTGTVARGGGVTSTSAVAGPLA
jgi:hypothetical protein